MVFYTVTFCDHSSIYISIIVRMFGLYVTPLTCKTKHIPPVFIPNWTHFQAVWYPLSHDQCFCSWTASLISWFPVFLPLNIQQIHWLIFISPTLYLNPSQSDAEFTYVKHCDMRHEISPFTIRVCIRKSYSYTDKIYTLNPRWFLLSWCCTF